LVTFDEPFTRLLTQGMVLKDGEVMSKSKGNTVDPDSVIEKYGADTLRLFILFAAPPEDQLEWNDNAIEGSWKFLSRVWQLVDSYYKRLPGPPKAAPSSAADKELQRQRHAAIKKVTEDIDGGFKFNTAISSIMVLVNAIERYARATQDKNQQVLSEAIATVVMLLAPFTPHLCEELWQKIGNDASIARAAWPAYDQAALAQDIIPIVAQVNGKVRGKFDVPVDITDEKLKELVLADARVQHHLTGKTVKKIIVVPKKLVSIVAV